MKLSVEDRQKLATYLAEEKAEQRREAGLSSLSRFFRNVSGAERRPIHACTAGDQNVPVEIRCEGRHPKISGKGFGVPQIPDSMVDEAFPGHRLREDPLWPEVDYDGQEPLAHEFLVTYPPILAAVTAAESRLDVVDREIANLEANLEVLRAEISRKREDREPIENELGLADARRQEFLGAHSPAWVERLLAGPPVAAAAVAEPRPPEPVPAKALAMLGPDGEVRHLRASSRAV